VSLYLFSPFKSCGWVDVYRRTRVYVCARVAWNTSPYNYTIFTAPYTTPFLLHRGKGLPPCWWHGILHLHRQYYCINITTDTTTLLQGQLSALLYTIGCLGFLVADGMEYFTFTDSKILKTNILCSLIGVHVCGVCVGVCGCAYVRVWTIVCSVIGV
jgi:hypothetical protein